MMGYHFNPYKLFSLEPKHDENGNYVWDKDGYIICESKETKLEPRRAGGANYFESTAIAPGAKILPCYKRMGLTPNAFKKLGTTRNAMWLMECMSGRNYKPLYETLLKEKEYELFKYVSEKEHRNNAEAFFAAWRICKRNRYDHKKNFVEWIDLVDMLIETEKDYHNPHYVCPKDLHDMHQRILALRKRKQDEIELKRNMEKNKDYTKRIEKYLDMDIHNDELTIIVLPDIPAFKEEGDHLGHCVYRCGYYKKVDSLILSAREGGKRWETIEVDLRTFKILQCYGYGDKHTERHKEICDLVMANMWQIKERREGKNKMKKIAA